MNDRGEEITITPEVSETRKTQEVLIYSEVIGKPPYVLNPKDLEGGPNLCPGKIGSQLRIVDNNTIVKYGEDIRLAEAEAMVMIAQKTSICCPKVKAAYIWNDVGFIWMSYERGRSLLQVWEEASETERENLIQRLKQYVTEMRTIRGSFIGGVDHSSCRDGVFDWDHASKKQEYGPFHDEASFNEGIILAYANSVPPKPEGWKRDPESSSYNRIWEFEQLIRSFKGHDIVFTHGDLHPNNMLVREDGTIVLLDWGLAGFWPDYWEFHRAKFMGTWRPDFVRQLERFIPAYYQEAFVMRYVFDKILG